MKGLMVVLKDRGSVFKQADSWIFYSEHYYTRIPLPTSSLPDNSTGIRLKFNVSKINKALARIQYNLQTLFHKSPGRACPSFTAHTCNLRDPRHCRINSCREKLTAWHISSKPGYFSTWERHGKKSSSFYDTFIPNAVVTGGASNFPEQVT